MGSKLIPSLCATTRAVANSESRRYGLSDKYLGFDAFNNILEKLEAIAVALSMFLFRFFTKGIQYVHVHIEKLLLGFRELLALFVAWDLVVPCWDKMASRVLPSC